jgi:GntR family transcriptional regulator/MocR family aminotransferase
MFYVGKAMVHLKSKINFLFVTPSHQFPTGKIMPISRRIDLLNWSMQSSDRYIIEDDYDSEFKYETDNIPSLQSLDRHQCVIYTGTFSKTMLPGLRISYMILPPDILRQYKKYHADLMQSSNSLALYTLHYFIKTGGYARHIKRMNHHYEMKRKELIKQLRNRFGSSMVIEDIPAGLHFLARFKTKKAYESVEAMAKKEKLEIYSIRRFELENRLKMEGEIQLIIGFANIKAEQIPGAVERLNRVINGNRIEMFYIRSAGAGSFGTLFF